MTKTSMPSSAVSAAREAANVVRKTLVAAVWMQEVNGDVLNENVTLPLVIN